MSTQTRFSVALLTLALGTPALMACGGEGGSEPPITPGPTQRDLGELPEALQINWPVLPETTHEVEASNATELETALSTPAQRIRVTGDVDGAIVVRSDDTEIVVDEGVSMGDLLIERGVARVRVIGGRWESVTIAIPASFLTTPTEYRAEWLARDITFQGLTVDAENMAFELRGRRVAVLDSVARAVRYSLWTGDTGPLSSEDIIIAGNDFDSEGPEPTVRLVRVNRSVTVDNRLTNGLKHNYRVHGESDLAYAARNTMIDTGIMIGTLPGDAVGRIYIDDNVLYHTSPSLLLLDPNIEQVVTRGNVAYSDVVSCWVCSNPSSNWVAENNEVNPYQPPPEP